MARGHVYCYVVNNNDVYIGRDISDVNSLVSNSSNRLHDHMNGAYWKNSNYALEKSMRTNGFYRTNFYAVSVEDHIKILKNQYNNFSKKWKLEKDKGENEQQIDFVEIYWIYQARQSSRNILNVEQGGQNGYVYNMAGLADSLIQAGIINDEKEKNKINKTVIHWFNTDPIERLKEPERFFTSKIIMNVLLLNIGKEINKNINLLFKDALSNNRYILNTNQFRTNFKNLFSSSWTKTIKNLSGKINNVLEPYNLKISLPKNLILDNYYIDTIQVKIKKALINIVLNNLMSQKDMTLSKITSKQGKDINSTIVNNKNIIEIDISKMLWNKRSMYQQVQVSYIKNKKNNWWDKPAKNPFKDHNHTNDLKTIAIKKMLQFLSKTNYSNPVEEYKGESSLKREQIQESFNLLLNNNSSIIAAKEKQKNTRTFNLSQNSDIKSRITEIKYY